MVAAVNTDNTVTRQIGGDMVIGTSYDTDPRVSMSVTDVTGSINGMRANAGDLIMYGKSFDSASFGIDGSGNLLVVSSSGADKYSIDSNGNLIHTP